MKKYLAAAAMIGMFFLSLSVFAQQPPAQPEKQAKPAPGDKAPLAKLKDYLNLTPEQVTKLKDFQKARQDEQKAFREQMKKFRDELTPLLKDQKADQNKINGLIDQITKLSADRMKKAIANRNPMEKILTQEQLDKLKNARGFLQRRGLGGMAFGRGLMGFNRMMRQGMGFGPGLGIGRGFMGLQMLRGLGMQGHSWRMGMRNRHGMRRGIWRQE